MLRTSSTTRGVRTAGIGSDRPPGRFARGRLLVASAAAAPSPAGASSSNAPITLYSGQHVQTTQSLVNAFEKKTGIQVNVRFDDEDTLADQLVAEGSHARADVFLTENSPPLQYLASKHLLAPVAKSTLATVPSKYNSPNGLWAGVSARVSVMVYNTSLLKPSQLPTSAMQLAQPQWKGKIAVAGGETDFQPIVTSVARTYGNGRRPQVARCGEERMRDSHQYPDNETIADEVNRGQVALGIVNQYYWYRERAEVGAANMHSAIAYFAPHDVGYVVDVSGAGILRSSQHVSEAQKLVAFFDSAQGPGDHRPQRQFRVPHRLGGEHGAARDAVRPAPTELDHHSGARHRGGGDQAPPGGTALVSAGAAE